MVFWARLKAAQKGQKRRLKKKENPISGVQYVSLGAFQFDAECYRENRKWTDEKRKIQFQIQILLKEKLITAKNTKSKSSRSQDFKGDHICRRWNLGEEMGKPDAHCITLNTESIRATWINITYRELIKQAYWESCKRWTGFPDGEVWN